MIRANFIHLLLINTLLLTACGSSGGSSSQFTPGTTTNNSSTPPANAQLEGLGISTISQGSNSNIVNRSASTQLITNDLDWLNFWQNHSATVAPTIDFGSNVVVVRVREQFSTGGYGTEIISVSQDINSGEIYATIRDSDPVPGTPQASVLTQPFHFVTAPFQTAVATLRIVQQQSELSFVTIDSGTDSAIGMQGTNTGPSLHIARTQTEFDSFWSLHSPGSNPPTVDFNTSMVIAVLSGSNPNFGNSVRTKRLVHDNVSNELRIIYEVDPYRGGAAPPQILIPETPFQILRVAKTSGTLRNETVTTASFQSLTQGGSASYTGSQELLVIRDSQTFDSIWQQRVGGRTPVVDFSTKQVVAFFNGQSTSNVSASISRIELSEDGEVLTRVSTNSLGFGGGQSAFSLVTMDKNGGPARLEIVDVTPRP